MSEPEVEVRFQRRAFVELDAATLHEILQLRGDVFVVEQKIHQENDLDGRDPVAVHVLGRTPDGELVATARMLLDDSPVEVGRIVVREESA